MNPKTRTHTSCIFAQFWIWGGCCLIASPLSLMPLTVWRSLGGLQQPHRWQQVQPCTTRYFYVRCPSCCNPHYFGLGDQLRICWLTYPKNAGLKIKVSKGRHIYTASLLQYLTLKELRYGSYSFTWKLHNTCLYFISIHQMAPPQNEVADI